MFMIVIVIVSTSARAGSSKKYSCCSLSHSKNGTCKIKVITSQWVVEVHLYSFSSNFKNNTAQSVTLSILHGNCATKCKQVLINNSFDFEDAPWEINNSVFVYFTVSLISLKVKAKSVTCSKSFKFVFKNLKHASSTEKEFQRSILCCFFNHLPVSAIQSQLVC